MRAGLAAQQQACDFPDVAVIFCIERTPEQQQREADEGSSRPGRMLGDPYPAHRLILSLGCTFLETRLKRSCWQATGSGASHASGSDGGDMQAAKRRRIDGEPQGSPGHAGDKLSTAASALPEVLVPLSSEAARPFARQAIEFIYAGTLSADLDFEALLRIREQACYLGVHGCPEACDRAMVAWLQQQETGQQQQQQDGAGPSSAAAAAEPRVLQAYACLALFPDPDTSLNVASFNTVRVALAKQLVSYFRDAVTTLNWPDLLPQLLQLPAVALKELLAADNFGTDTEDSIFRLLAHWLDAHKGLPEATRAELCGLVRLHRLSSTYLYHVLPAFEPFAISRAELGSLLQYAAAGEEGKEELLACDDKRRGSPWYCSPPRRQVVPEGGLAAVWSITKEQLEQALRKMLEGGRSVQKPVVNVHSCGRDWGMSLCLVQKVPEGSGTSAGGSVQAFTVLSCNAYGVCDSDVMTLVSTARVAVHRRDGAQREEVWIGHRLKCAKRMGKGCCIGHTQLPLEPAAAADAAGGGGGAAAGPVEAQVAALVARFSRFMHEGKITGIVHFPRPSRY